VVTARVTRVEPYGLFVRIDHSEDLVGLVHVRNLTDGARPSLETLRSDYPIGTTLRVLVFRVDAAKRRVSLALKPSLLAAAARNAALIEHSVDGGDGDNVNDDAGDDAANDADDDASDEVLTENAATHDDGRRGEKRKAAAVLAVPFEWPRGDADDVSKRRRVSDDIAAASTADVVDDDAAIDRGDVGERADVDTDNRRGARPNAQVRAQQ
jgi:predicted RNA-binding protein with RPS1 domain